MISRAWVIVCMVLLGSACSDNDKQDGSQAKPVKHGDHVWKTQTDQIDRAREVENLLQKSHDRQQQAIDEQAR